MAYVDVISMTHFYLSKLRLSKRDDDTKHQIFYEVSNKMASYSFSFGMKAQKCYQPKC